MNRIARYFDRQPHRTLAQSAFIAGQVARRRGDPLNKVLLTALRNWPGSDEEKAQLLAAAAFGFIAAAEVAP